MKFFLILILSFNVALCFEDDEAEFYRQLEAKRQAKAEYMVYVNEIRSAVAEEVYKELNLHCFGTKGRMLEKIEDLGMDFVAHRRATVKEARALHLLIIDKFVKAVNAHEKIQPFLEVSPFTYERAHVFITFKNKDHRQYCDGTVASLMNVTGNANAEENRNKLFYDSYDPFKELLNDLLEETHQEAVAINSLDPVSCPEVHQGNVKEEVLDQFFESFVKDVKNQFGLYCHYIGGQLADDIESIGGSFTLYQPVNKEQARQLLVSVTEMLLKGLNDQKELEPYFKEHPFTSNRIKFRISFRTNRNGYFYETSIKDVIFENDEIEYDMAVKGYDGLSDYFSLGSESYSIAFKRVETAPVFLSNFWYTFFSFFNSF